MTALLSAILAFPDEDTPRLAYADYLEEQDGADGAAHAAVIRHHIATCRAEVYAPGCAATVDVFPGLPELEVEGKVTFVIRPVSVVIAPPIDGVAYTTRRGFVDEVVLPPSMLDALPLILARHPVRVVRVAWRWLTVQATLTPVPGGWEATTASAEWYPSRVVYTAPTREAIVNQVIASLTDLRDRLPA